MKKLLVVVISLFVLSLTMVAGAAEPQYHSVAAGDTLYKLAQSYETTVVASLDFNPGITPDKLEVGQKLLVPTTWYNRAIIPALWRWLTRSPKMRFVPLTG